MTQQDLDRIAELEELLDIGEELDDDDREELKSLQADLRNEKRHSKAMDAWHKAKEVYRLSFPNNSDDDPSYALTTKPLDEMSSMYEWDKSDYVVERIQRPSFAVIFDSWQQVYGRLPTESE